MPFECRFECKKRPRTFIVFFFDTFNEYGLRGANNSSASDTRVPWNRWYSEEGDSLHVIVRQTGATCPDRFLDWGQKGITILFHEQNHSDVELSWVTPGTLTVWFWNKSWLSARCLHYFSVRYLIYLLLDLESMPTNFLDLKRRQCMRKRKLRMEWRAFIPVYTLFFMVLNSEESTEQKKAIDQGF